MTIAGARATLRANAWRTAATLTAAQCKDLGGQTVP
jgi:hypothetical protein